MPIEVESPEEYGYENIAYNLSESSVTDQTLESLDLRIPNLKLLYNEHRGNSSLRQLIVAETTLDKDDVLVTGGAAGALYIVATSQLSKGDHLVVVRPNYATNLETPRAIGCEISFIDLDFDSGFQLDPSSISAALRPNTKLVSITCPHNPSGTLLSRAALDDIVHITRQHPCLLLVDETYRDITYKSPLPNAATLADHVVSVSSLSKSYGIPGIRLGWLITKNKRLQQTFLAAKEQISISGSVIDEWIAEQVLSRKAEILPSRVAEMRKRLKIVEDWIKREEMVEWVEPQGGVVCFPRLKAEPLGGMQAFYNRLLEKYKTYVGPGHWFEMPARYFRIGYGWPSIEELQKGLETISMALRDNE
jgi:aspartate/methionine/tyrosine aminotransferase